MPRPRVLFVNRSYWPDGEATGQLLTQLCESLAPNFDVSVLAGQPNANIEDVEFKSRGTQIRNGVAIRRVPHTRLPKGSFVGRVVNYVSFWCSALFAALFSRRPDVIVVETDPPLLCLLGAVVSWRHRCRLVVYLQDIYPDLAIALGKLRDGTLASLVRRAFFAVYRRADHVVVLSEDMRRTIEAGGVASRRISTIANWTDTGLIHPKKEDNPFRHREGLADKFVVMYSGNLGLTQRLDDVLRAANKLRQRSDIVFIFVGQGASRPDLEEMAESLHLNNVRFLDYQPSSELSNSLSAADIHLVPLEPRIVNYVMPSKLYGILASGTPILAITASQCELAQIVTDEEIGYVVKPGDPAELARQIERLADHAGHLQAMGQKARDLAVERYDRELSVASFAGMLSSLTGSSNSREFVTPQPGQNREYAAQ